MQLMAQAPQDQDKSPHTPGLLRLWVAGFTREGRQDLHFHSRDYPRPEPGYEFSGRVELMERPNYVVLRLADFCALRPPEVKGIQSLQLRFEARIHGLSGAVEAGSALCGNFNNKLSHHILGRGNRLSFQARVNGQAIAPEFRFEPTGRTVFPQPFGRSVEPVPLEPSSAWHLQGELTLELGEEGDSIMIAPIIPAPAFHARITLLRVPS